MTRPDGVYFGLPEADYHGDRALGSTDIKNLIQGPEVYWAETPMNPLYEVGETKSTLRGSAYHTLILEGEEVFNAKYAIEPCKDDYPNALYTAEEIGEALAKMGLSKTGKKGVLISRLLDADPTAQIWDVITEQFRDENEGRLPISKKLVAEIQYAARFIVANPFLRDAFKGGVPEVSVFWTVDGVRRKLRVDYLKPGLNIDLKSYTNAYKSRADVAIHNTAARFGHDLQAAWYRPGLNLARSLPWFVMNGAAVSEEWEAAFRKGPEIQTYFIYQSADKIPMARAKWMRYDLQTFKIAEMQCENAVQLYLQCVEQFGEDPWIIPEKPTQFEDEAFPMFRR